MKAELRRRADPQRAPAMQAYMKSALPYRGVPAPALRRLCRELFTMHPFESFTDWRGAAVELWRSATHREERYAAIALTGAPLYRAFQTLETLPMYEEFIVSGAWWDYVDEVAHRFPLLLERHPREMKRTMRAWARDEDVWKRRGAILCQLLRKRETDLALLWDCIEPSLARPEFWLRKAIGWALRDLAKSRPEEVLRYVKRERRRLSPLSKREALKGMLRDGRVTAVP